MKRIVITLFLLIGAVIANAREPYGDYVARYIVTGNGQSIQYHDIYNPLKITHTGIRVQNTNAGTKTWATNYLGTFTMTNAGGSETFHRFYLTNQHVYFEISDRALLHLNGKYYYLINFDGQFQLAERL